MADLILIPVVLLLLYKIQFNKDGFYNDYLSIERTNVLRGVMVLDVVLFHFCLDYLDVNQNILRICQGDDAVKVFFFLSGYGLVYSYKKKGGNYLNGFFTHRFAKILIPFIIAAVLNILYFKLTGDVYGTGEFSWKTIYNVFVYLGYPVVYNSWYVIELMALYIAFFISFKIAKNNVQKGVNCLVVVTMLIMCGFYALYAYNNWMYIWFYSTYAFAMGAVWAAKEPQLTSLIHKKFNYIYMVVIPFVIMVILFRRNILILLDAELYVMSKNLLLGPFIVVGIIVAGMKIKVNCKVWKWLGNISYELFLFHGLCYNGLRSNLVYIENDILFIILVLVTSICGAIILHFVSKFILKYYFKLINKNLKKVSA